MSFSPLFLRSALALALSAGFAAANAQSVDVAKELQLLKTRISELESQLNKTNEKINVGSASAGGVDAAEFNRVKVKTEALEDNFEAQGFKGLKLNGFMDPTFISNKARRSTSMNFLNNFDARDKGNAYAYDNSYFGNVWLDVQKEVEGGTKWRLTLAPHKGAASGYNLGSIVHEASVSVPLGDLSTRLIAGQIPDWSGYEYIASNQNKLITHNMLFDFTMPNFYNGVGIEMTRGQWISKFLVGNMNATRFDSSNRSGLVTGRVDYAKGEYMGFGGAFQIAKTGGNSVQLAEVDGYYMRGPWTMQGQFSLGSAKNGAYSGDAKWTGLSGLAAYKLTPRLELVARADLINNKRNGGGTLGAYNGDCDQPERDAVGALTGNTITGLCPDGINGFGNAMAFQNDSQAWESTGKGVNRSSLSLGLNYVYTPNVTFKAEYRLDKATGNVFYYEKDGSYRNNNRMLGLSTVVSF